MCWVAGLLCLDFLDLFLDLLGLRLRFLNGLLGIMKGYPGDLDNADAAEEEVDRRKTRGMLAGPGNCVVIRVCG